MSEMRNAVGTLRGFNLETAAGQLRCLGEDSCIGSAERHLAGFSGHLCHESPASASVSSYPLRAAVSVQRYSPVLPHLLLHTVREALPPPDT